MIEPTIRLVVTDIEGCINRDENSYDFEAIDQLRLYSRKARRSTVLPPLALCSGRQYPFVEAVSAFLDLHSPSVFENGAGVFRPGQSLTTRLLLDETATSYRWGGRGRLAVADRLAARLNCSVELGKEAIITLHPAEPERLADLEEAAQCLLGAWKIDAEVGASATAIDICPPRTGKDAGILWLSTLTAVPLEQIAVFGDGPSDLKMFSVAGISGAPANASAAVRSRADFKSTRSDARGLIQFIEHITDAAAFFQGG